MEAKSKAVASGYEPCRDPCMHCSESVTQSHLRLPNKLVPNHLILCRVLLKALDHKATMVRDIGDAISKVKAFHHPKQMLANVVVQFRPESREAMSC